MLSQPCLNFAKGNNRVPLVLYRKLSNVRFPNVDEWKSLRPGEAVRLDIGQNLGHLAAQRWTKLKTASVQERRVQCPNSGEFS
jgi:hypothetical protein